MIITFIKFELHYYDVNQGVSTLPLLFRRWHTLPFVYQKSLFFYRAPAFNTCGVRYCFTNSVCLSVCLSVQCRYCVKTDGQIVTLFDVHYSSFLSLTSTKKIPRKLPPLGR